MTPRMNFTFPLRMSDLAIEEGSGQYFVQEIVPPRNIKDKLQEIKTFVGNDAPGFIEKSFDTFYSVISQFYQIDGSVRDKAWRILMDGISKFVISLSSTLESANCHVDKDTQLSYLNSLKMAVYLLCQFMEVIEDSLTKEASKTLLTSKKKNANKASGSWNWDQERAKFIQILNNISQLPIQRLWNPPVIEEEFLFQIINTCFKLLENSATAKQKDLRDVILNVIALCVKKHGLTLSCTLKIIQLLQNSEHLASPLAQLVEMITEKQGIKNIVPEIIREIGHLGANELSHDTAGTRALSQFLIELTEVLPSLVLSSISLLLVYLDDTSYVMRNCVLIVIGRIVIKLLSRDNLDAKSKELREQLLDRLEDHLHDVHAFVRSRSIQVWSTLCIEKVIPLPRQDRLLQLVVGRLQDKSAVVRKQAVNCLKCFVQSNPFAAKLSLEKLNSLYEKEQAKLQIMMPDEGISIDAAAMLATKEACWETMEADITKAINEMMELDDNDDRKNLEVEEMPLTQFFDEIRCALEKADYIQAVTLLLAARDAYPYHSVLNPVQDESEDPLSSQNTEMPSSESLLSILRNVYLAPFINSVRDASESPQNNAILNIEEVAATLLSKEPEEGLSNEQVASDLAKQQILVQFLQDSIKFAQQIHACLPLICNLLNSCTVSDNLEAIEFFVVVYKFGVPDALIGIRQMLSLIWVEETAVNEAVMSAYKTLYLDSDISIERKSRSLNIVKNLTHLLQGMSLGEMASFEQIVVNWMKNKEVDSEVIKVLWKRFCLKIANTTQTESHMALILLGMIANAEVQIVNKNMDVLIEIGLGSRAEEDFAFAKDVCSVFLKMATPRKAATESNDSPFRLPEDHLLFSRLIDVIVHGINRTEDKFWTPLAEEGVKVLYYLAEHPDVLCGKMIQEIIKAIFGSGGNGNPNTHCHTIQLSRLLAITGHVALYQLYHLDMNIFTEMKRRELLKGQKEQTSKRKEHSSLGGASSVTKNKECETTTEDEMGLGNTPTAEDAVAEFICRVGETEIVTGSNLLGLLRPLIVSIAADPVAYPDVSLQTAATLALAKYMMVSSSFCESQMPLLITLLQKSEHSVIRENVICLLGDLSLRFPNLVEPWTSFFYSRIKDESVAVRKNTLSVLMHLILNDMIKVKGQISDVALCILDSDAHISNMSKQLFTDLSHKGNALYNLLPDIIGRLSDPEYGCEENDFQTVIKFLLSFIKKERQIESLVEKLCHRLRAARTERQWQDLVFCLALFSYNESSILKLQENIGCFVDKLHCNFVYESLIAIINSAKKQAGIKAETKTCIEEFEAKLQVCRSKGINEDDAVVFATPKASKPGKSRTGKSTSKRMQSNTKRRRQRAKVYSSDTDEDDEFEIAAPTTGGHSVRRSTRQTRAVNTKVKIPNFFSSSDSDG